MNNMKDKNVKMCSIANGKSDDVANDNDKDQKKIKMCHIVKKEKDFILPDEDQRSAKMLMCHVVKSSEEDISANKVGEKMDEHMVDYGADILCKMFVRTAHKMASTIKSDGKGKQVVEFDINGIQERDNGLFYKDKMIMNATVGIISINSDNTGNSHFEYVKCYILINNGRRIELTKRVRDFRSGRWLLDYSAVSIDYEQKEAMQIIEKYLQLLLNKHSIDFIEYKSRQGWCVIDNAHVYVTNDGVIGVNKMIRAKKGLKWYDTTTINYNEVENYKRVRGMESITKNNPTAIILFLYLIQSICYTLYEDAAVVPKYVLFLEGKRGSRKTSLSLALLKPTGQKSAKYSFKDTPAGLEAGFAENADAVMVIDDLKPTLDSTERKQSEHNLELLTRCFGDANGKNRNLDFGKDGPTEQYISHGGAVFTGEYFNSMSASSMARTLILHIDNNTVDNNVLGFYQQHPDVLAGFLHDFIYYISSRYHETVDIINKIVTSERTKLGSFFSNSRYAEYVGQLKAAASLFCFYGVSIGCVGREEIDTMVSYYTDKILNVVVANDEELKGSDPAVMISRSVIELISINSNLSNDDLIVDDVYVYITETKLVDCYKNYVTMHGFRNYEYQSTTLRRCLKDAGILISHKEGKKNRYSAKVRGHGNTRFLWLKKANLIQLSGLEVM